MKVIFAAIVLAVSITVPAALAEDLPAPAPTPSPSATAVSKPPASAEMVAWALRWRRAAANSYVRWNKARWCWDMERVVLQPDRPRRAASQARWYAAGREWKHAHARAHEGISILRYRMIHPTGCGWERWRPLVRWHWPSYLVETALQVIRYESGGQAGVSNGGSGAGGLFQLLPAPEGWSNPDYNVWYAYHRKFVPAGGWSPWAGCAAF